jgi:glycosyltransferase involved in cell wall biosynthesis
MEVYTRAKIAHLTSVHSLYDIRIFHKECKSLTQSGYQVTLIVPHEGNEVVDGVKIKSVPKPKNRFDRMTRVLWRVYWMAIEEKAHLYHFHDPELIVIGILLKLLRKKVIYDVHEDVPRQMFSKRWIHPTLRSVIAWSAALTEWIGGQCFDGVNAATPTIAQRFPPCKTVTVRNFPFLSELVQDQFIPYKQRPPVLIYVGGISEYRGAKDMVQAVGLLPSHLRARLQLAGDFSPTGFEEELKCLPGWERVDFLGWQSREHVFKLLGRARIGLVTLHPIINYLTSYPIKLFEYMCAGLPVIASDFPLWRKIVEDAGCGLLVDPLDSGSIAEAIQWLLVHPEEAEAMGRRGQDAVRKYYNWDTEAKKLVAFYRAILKSQPEIEAV